MIGIRVVGLDLFLSYYYYMFIVYNIFYTYVKYILYFFKKSVVKLYI